MHAATFGGNPIAARAGIAAIEMIEQENLLERGRAMSQLFEQRLQELAGRCELIKEVRVCGMMIGIELTVEGSPFVQACLERQLLINCTHDNRLATAARPQHYARRSQRGPRHPDATCC